MADLKVSRYESMEVIEAFNLLGEEQRIELSAEEGDWISVGIDFLGAVESDLSDEDGNIIEPVQEGKASDNGNGFLGRAYNIARNGVYKLTIRAEHATATIIKFGRETGQALIGRGEPNNTTCYVCKKTVSFTTKSVLAAHGIVIPALADIDVDLDEIMERLNIDAAQFLDESNNWIPEGIRRRIMEPLRRCFDMLKSNFMERFPQALRDPIGWAAMLGCQRINLCAP